MRHPSLDLVGKIDPVGAVGAGLVRPAHRPPPTPPGPTLTPPPPTGAAAMLDDALAAQLKTHLEKLTQPVDSSPPSTTAPSRRSSVSCSRQIASLSPRSRSWPPATTSGARRS